MPHATLTEATAAELAALIRKREVSVVDVAKAFLAAIEEKNGTLKAIIRHRPDDVMRQAQALDRRVQSDDDAPLLGVPFTVKDTIWVEGETLSQGSLLFKDFVAPKDAVAVERLRAAGGLFLGITNCSEFACKGVTTNKLIGATLNPWDLSRTPGGSSGGAASAVSAGLGPIAICTDGGGSTRRPAAHTGVVGLKPTAGLIPHPFGFAEPAFHNCVIGIMARDTADTMLALRAMAGPHTHDPVTPVAADPARLREADDEGNLKGLRIAFSPRLGRGYPVDTNVAKLVAAGVDHLAAAGAHVELADPAWPAGADESALIPLQFAGLAAIHGDAYRKDPSRFDPDIGVQIEKGFAATGPAMTAALFLREEMYRTLADLFSTYDLLVTPTTPVEAWKLPALGPATIEGKAVDPRGHAVFTPLFNHTFLPACSVPCGLTSNQLPVGLQVVGRRFEDKQVMRAVACVEAAMNGAFRRPRRIVQ